MGVTRSTHFNWETHHFPIFVSLSQNVIVSISGLDGSEIPRQTSSLPNNDWVNCAGGMSVRIALAFLLLTGCASANADDASRHEPDQLRMLTTNALCKPYLQSQNLAGERQRRGLGGCSRSDQVCSNASDPVGSPNYLRCRANATLRTNSQCYFNGPSTGRLGGSLSNTDLICSEKEMNAAGQPDHVLRQIARSPMT
jgi:hypothetical protein